MTTTTPQTSKEDRPPRRRLSRFREVLEAGDKADAKRREERRKEGA